MPAPGDQHSSVANPFVDPPQRVSEYTAIEIATLQSRLEKQLGPEYISSRSGPSGLKVHYITAEKIIALANEVFGFNGWSSSIQNIQVDFVDEHPQTSRVSLGLSVIVRVTLRDGTYHEDLGYGHIENCKGKAAAFEKAKKEGTTDALKRALRHFGNVLGNCIYDKSYLQKVTKIKPNPAKFDEGMLHRHPDFVPKNQEGNVVKAESSLVPHPQNAQSVPAPATAAATSTSAQPSAGPPMPALFSADSFEDDDFLGDLDEADFNISEEGHPDEVMLSTSDTSILSNAPNDKSQFAGNNGNNNSNAPMQPPAKPLERTGSNGNNFSRVPQQPQTPNAAPRTNAFAGASNNSNPPANAARPAGQFNQNRPAPPQPNNANRQFQPKPPPPPAAAALMTPPQPASAAPPPGEAIFFSARAVSKLTEEAIVNGQVSKEVSQFNPKLESPSIRKTPGIDHTKSKPVSRAGQHVPPTGAHSDKEDNNNTKPAAAPAQAAAAAGRQSAATMNRPGPPLTRGNVMNPSLDQSRRIGVPGGGFSSSPLANRNQYKPPTLVGKRTVDGQAAPGPASAVHRAPLGDVSNNAPINAGGAPVGDAKRQRTA